MHVTPGEMIVQPAKPVARPHRLSVLQVKNKVAGAVAIVPSKNIKTGRTSQSYGARAQEMPVLL